MTSERVYMRLLISVNSDFRRDVNIFFAVLGRLVVTDVSGQPIGPIVKR